MDRQTVYPGQILPETTLLQMTKDAMISVGKLSSAMLGTGTVASGFAVTPTGPASLQVLCAPGEIYSLTSIDALAFSSLPADTTHSILKQGILLDGITLSCPAPGTTGQSINYLVQATYQDTDSTPVLLPYYNSANPAMPYSGMGNNGLTQNTSRKGSAVVAVKAGASATTGSQTTPAPDAGYVGLYVVTVAFGQTTITGASIAQYSGAPLMPGGLLQSMQAGNSTGAADIGTANAYSANFTPAITALSDKMTLCIKAANANTTASTFTPAPGVISPSPIVGAAHSALQGGEIVPTGDLWLQWNSSIGSGSWVLIDSTGGAAQIANGTQSKHAVAIGQLAALGMIKTVKRQVINSGGTYTPSSGMVFADVELVGGGGGGGGALGGSSVSAAAGGGGAGGYSRKLFTAAQIGASQSVAIGTAGSGGAGGNNAGSAGSASTFGALLTSNGGAGGGGSNSYSIVTLSGSTGTGGSASGGDINIQGAQGGAGFTFTAGQGGLSGAGGNSQFGCGGAQAGPSSSGNSGTGRGTGGSGGAATTASAVGGSGMAGICVILEYCTQ